MVTCLKFPGSYPQHITRRESSGLRGSDVSPLASNRMAGRVNTQRTHHEGTHSTLRKPSPVLHHFLGSKRQRGLLVFVFNFHITIINVTGRKASSGSGIRISPFTVRGLDISYAASNLTALDLIRSHTRFLPCTRLELACLRDEVISDKGEAGAWLHSKHIWGRGKVFHLRM